MLMPSSCGSIQQWMTVSLGLLLPRVKGRPFKDYLLNVLMPDRTKGAAVTEELVSDQW